MRELGPSERSKDPKKMLVYCPDCNGTEKRKKDAFYNVPNSSIEVVSVKEHNNLVVIHGGIMEDGRPGQRPRTR